MTAVTEMHTVTAFNQVFKCINDLNEKTEKNIVKLTVQTVWGCFKYC